MSAGCTGWKQTLKSSKQPLTEAPPQATVLSTCFGTVASCCAPHQPFASNPLVRFSTNLSSCLPPEPDVSTTDGTTLTLAGPLISIDIFESDVSGNAYSGGDVTTTQLNVTNSPLPLVFSIPLALDGDLVACDSAPDSIKQVLPAALRWRPGC